MPQIQFYAKPTLMLKNQRSRQTCPVEILLYTSNLQVCQSSHTQIGLFWGDTAINDVTVQSKPKAESQNHYANIVAPVSIHWSEYVTNCWSLVLKSCRYCNKPHYWSVTRFKMWLIKSSVSNNKTALVWTKVSYTKGNMFESLQKRICFIMNSYIDFN